MTGPIRSTAGRVPSRATVPASGRQPVPASTTQARPAAGFADLDRPPARPAGAPGTSGTGETESASSASQRRASLPMPTGTGALASMGASSSGAAWVAMSPSAQLRSLAEDLSQLEAERATLQASLDELQARRRDAGVPGAGERGDEVGRLQSRTDQARGQLASLQARHEKETGELADAERKLASARRQLEGLTLAAESRPAQPARPARTRTGRRGGAKAASATKATPAAAKPDPRSPAEVEAQARIKQLEGERDSLKTQMEAASRRVAEARAALKRDTDFAALVLDPRSYEPRIDEAVATNLNRFLAHYELPAIDRVPQGEDTRHASYLDMFTNVDQGPRRLDEPLLENPAHSFSAFSALYSTLWPGRVNESLLRNLLGGDMSAVMAAVRAGGEGLGKEVGRHVVAQFAEEMRGCASAAAAMGTPDGTTARRVRMPSGNRVTQTALAEGRARARDLVPLQELPAHRGRIVLGAIQQATSMMKTIADDYRAASGDVQRSQFALDGALKDQTALVERGEQLTSELGAAQAALSGLRDERRQRDAAQSSPSAQSAQPASRDAAPDAAIPQLPAAAGSSSPDVDARRMRLRGDVDRHGAQADEARSRVDQTARDIGEAQAELRRSAQAHEAAAAALAREAANASREHDEVRAAQAGLRERLAVTEARIGELRETLHQAPARRAAISDLAWERTVERHVGISDEAMRERAPETGHVGSYDSLSTLSQVVADLHAHVSGHADLRPVLAARNRREFDSAVARVPGGVTDLVFDHGRQVGRGFSNALDRTERATPLQHSSYSLDFVQGRVVVSHLHPHVPRRTLQVAALK
ncbi:putative nucleic acid-binding Zn-ribbon protein [Mitsuaria sp. BK045]|uniref:hypothetical protein n=1 Tax=unclassified Roseateles TaxID=2626991 RepID=UPI001613F03A|nr:MULTISPECIES: hypothetical protein [unclassified Roseateles]MBB3293826.1 putative nucleic acid-binding Zn-ribbon protein [Mitsuaria sp. BK041]MBB3363043.1 putative nucleic acid-binding Zn-ribbon protein [Mitsuaria sp. BK045]